MEKKHDFEGRFDEQFEPTGTDQISASWKFGCPTHLTLKDFIRQELIAVLERAKVEDIDEIIRELK